MLVSLDSYAPTVVCCFAVSKWMQLRAAWLCYLPVPTLNITLQRTWLVQLQMNLDFTTVKSWNVIGWNVYSSASWSCYTVTLLGKEEKGDTCFGIPVAIYMTVTCHTVWTRDNMENFYTALIHLLNTTRNSPKSKIVWEIQLDTAVETLVRDPYFPVLS